MRNSLINLSLATEALIIADTDFKSRNAAQCNEGADERGVRRDGGDRRRQRWTLIRIRALIGLHGAVTEYLITAQYPLPEMLAFRFAAPGPTLVFAYRLYDDASRADEIRENNGVVHPAFARPTGVALSS